MSAQFIATLTAVAVVATSNIWLTYATQADAQVTVIEHERVCRSNGDNGTSCKYLVYAEEEVFENTDNILYLKFDSADVRRSLAEGETYNCRVYGWRIPFLSMHRNIISCDE